MYHNFKCFYLSQAIQAQTIDHINFHKVGVIVTIERIINPQYFLNSFQDKVFSLSIHAAINSHAQNQITHAHATKVAILIQ